MGSGGGRPPCGLGGRVSADPDRAVSASADCAGPAGGRLPGRGGRWGGVCRGRVGAGGAAARRWGGRDAPSGRIAWEGRDDPTRRCSRNRNAPRGRSGRRSRACRVPTLLNSLRGRDGRVPPVAPRTCIPWPVRCRPLPYCRLRAVRQPPGAVAVVRRTSGAAGGRITEAGVTDALFCGPAPPRANPFAEVILCRIIAVVIEVSDGPRQLFCDAAALVRSQSNRCSQCAGKVWPEH